MPDFQRRDRRIRERHPVRPATPDRARPHPTYPVTPLQAQQPALNNQAAQRFAQSCPLALPGPSLCPFGGTCSACPAKVQPKLKIGRPGDKYEEEADRVAEQVMRMPEPRVQRQVEMEEENEETLQAKPLASQITPLVQRQIEPEEEEESVQTKPITRSIQRQEASPEEDSEARIQAKQAGGQMPYLGAGLAARLHALKGGGEPLPESVRNYFEPRFGYDFGRVRVHADMWAAEAAQALNARALTSGHDILFGARQYDPKSAAGRKLLAHELTHVVQQTHSPLVMRSDVIARKSVIKEEKALTINASRPPGYEHITSRTAALAKESADRIFITAWDNARIVAEARKKDIYLRRFSSDLGPDVQSVIAKTLLRMLKEMDARVVGLPLRFSKDGLILPPKGVRWSSPELAGIAEAIDPFQMHEFWSAYVKPSRRPKPSRRRIYVRRLKEAVSKLRNVMFGRAEENRFDHEYWEVRPDPYSRFQQMLVLRRGKHPADAIEKIFERLNRWSLCCAQFVQVAQLYALRHAYGRKTFRRIMPVWMARYRRKIFALRMQWSSGLTAKVIRTRERPDAAFNRIRGRQSRGVREQKTAATLLKEAPVGARVAWTNLQAQGTARHQNAVKLGQNTFGTHFPGGRKRFTREQIESRMARSTNINADDRYIRNNVFISRIEIYRTP